MSTPKFAFASTVCPEVDEPIEFLMPATRRACLWGTRRVAICRRMGPENGVRLFGGLINRTRAGIRY